MSDLALPVRELIVATPNTRIVRLDLSGQRLDFLAGQAVMVGARGQDLRKFYSIASSPAESRARRDLELLVQLASDGTLGEHLPGVTVGSELSVRGPFGSFHLPAQLRQDALLLVAGGTGIAPLRSILWEALLTQLPARISVFYSVRTPSEFAYHDQLRELARQGRINLDETVTREFEDGWTGHRGRVTASHLARLVASPSTLCFVCGPPSMVEDVPALLKELGIPASQIVTEQG